ncbi:hypothetical protein AMECASPLE_030007, partial [Ameca splendens]
MQTGFVLFYFLFPTISDQCCGNGGQKEVFIQGDKDAAAKPISADQHHHYKVVEGEVFVMPCDELHVASPIKWFKATKGKECGKEFVAEMEDSGAYSSLTGSYLTLQVINKTSLGCFQPNDSSVTLRVDAGGKIRCPGHDCYNNTAVVWYKKNKTVSEQFRISCENEGLLHLCTVYESDTGVYYCDRQITEQGVMWTFRRAVNVTVI